MVTTATITNRRIIKIIEIVSVIETETETETERQ